MLATYCNIAQINMLLQAVYSAFARFRAHHRLGANAQTALTEAQSGAISMLGHVSDTAGTIPATVTACADDIADDIAPGGFRGVPTHHSDMPSLAGAKAQQGSDIRWGCQCSYASMTSNWHCSNVVWLMNQCISQLHNPAPLLPLAQIWPAAMLFYRYLLQ